MSESEAFCRIVEIFSFKEVDFFDFFDNCIRKEARNLFLHKSFVLSWHNHVKIYLVLVGDIFERKCMLSAKLVYNLSRIEGIHGCEELFHEPDIFFEIFCIILFCIGIRVFAGYKYLEMDLFETALLIDIFFVQKNYQHPNTWEDDEYEEEESEFERHVRNC